MSCTVRKLPLRSSIVVGPDLTRAAVPERSMTILQNLRALARIVPVLDHVLQPQPSAWFPVRADGRSQTDAIPSRHKQSGVSMNPLATTPPMISPTR